MSDFNVHLGFEASERKLDGKPYKPFVLDLSKFPSLFVDYNYKVPRDEDTDVIMRNIISKCSSFYSEEPVKCVVIDGYEVSYNSLMKDGTYKRFERKTMLKRLDTYVSKIYDKYLQNPDGFIPRTKYIIVVCRIGSLEKEIISIMSKLGAIGVYLIIADDATEYMRFPELFKNLYGILTYKDAPWYEGRFDIKYDPQSSCDEVYTNLRFVMRLQRLRLQYENYPIIYPLHYRQDFINEKSPIKPHWRPRPRNRLIMCRDSSIF